ncbi:hypothetical protein EDD21DRAFT_440986 [Dissophora ornata]|nr:hypothetical protein EDD21DRAFT_440986 [Dissophora ornata]
MGGSSWNTGNREQIQPNPAVNPVGGLPGAAGVGQPVPPVLPAATSSPKFLPPTVVDEARSSTTKTSQPQQTYLTYHHYHRHHHHLNAALHSLHCIKMNRSSWNTGNRGPTPPNPAGNPVGSLPGVAEPGQPLPPALPAETSSPQFLSTTIVNEARSSS